MDVRTIRRWLRGGVVTVVAGLMAAVSGTAGLAAPRAATGGVQVDLPQLYGVSCPTVSWCMAVGRNDAGFTGLSGIWDRHTWRWLPNPAPSGKLAVFELTSVSCASPTSCVAFGDGPFGVQVGVRWNGRAWSFLPSIANRNTTITANAVSCVTAAYCVLGGHADAAHSAAAAQLWNGTSFRRLGPAFPAGANAIDLLSVSCRAVASCLAVGSYNIGTATHPLAESWNGTTWTIFDVPSTITNLNAVSCPQVNLCLAAGSTFITGQGFEAASALWDGSKLTALATPTPSGLIPSLSGISCGSATSCVAVGNTPFAELWTAKTGWALVPVPARSALFAVSCPQPAACLATGDAAGTSESTVMWWNGSAWQAVRQSLIDDLANVSCSAPSACLAVGVYLNPVLIQAPLTEGWNGRKWHQLPSPDAPGNAISVSCVARNFCMATTDVGTASWNGTKWSPLAQVHRGFSEVTCVSLRFCVDTNGATFAAWHGRAWRDVPTPAGPSGVKSFIQGVSCASPTVCLGFGNFLDSAGDPVGAFIDRWNGRTWRMANLPALDSDLLLALSCVRGSWCMAVGAGVAVRWSAGKWLVTAMPSVPTGGFTSMSCASVSMCMVISGTTTARWNGRNWRLGTVAGVLSGVSCPGPSFCLAVGQRSNQLNGDQLSLIERWNGRGWRPLTAPNP